LHQAPREEALEREGHVAQGHAEALAKILWSGLPTTQADRDRETRPARHDVADIVPIGQRPAKGYDLAFSFVQIITTQAKAVEFLAGLNAHYDLSGDGAYQLIAGLYYRHQDAFIPMVGLQWNDIRATFTYDVTMSTLKNYNNGRGAFEFSLIKEGIFNSFMGSKRDFKCPDLRNKAY
jgi:hypothetical protein